VVNSDRIGPMLKVEEVANLLHVHSNTVRRWADQGLIRTYRINRRGDRRFKQEDIARFLAELNVDRYLNKEEGSPTHQQV
jgi:excisionase family DNA binding protein